MTCSADWNILSVRLYQKTRNPVSELNCLLYIGLHAAYLLSMNINCHIQAIKIMLKEYVCSCARHESVWGCGGTVSLILKLCIRWRWVVSPLFPHWIGWRICRKVLYGWFRGEQKKSCPCWELKDDSSILYIQGKPVLKVKNVNITSKCFDLIRLSSGVILLKLN